MLVPPDRQISLSDPNSCSMATSGHGSDIVGYNVQVAVDSEHHLTIMHELTKGGSDHPNGWGPRRVRSLRHKQTLRLVSAGKI